MGYIYLNIYLVYRPMKKLFGTEVTLFRRTRRREKEKFDKEEEIS